MDVDLDKAIVSIYTDDTNLQEMVKSKLLKMGYPEVGDANTMMHKAKSFVSCASGKVGL